MLSGGGEPLYIPRLIGLGAFRLCLLVSLAPGIALGSEHVDLRLSVRGPRSEKPIAVKVTAMPAARDAQAVVTELAAPGAGALELSSTGVWTITADSEGLWAAPATIVLLPSRPPQPVELSLWPTAPVHGEVAAPAGTRPPDTVEVRFTPPAGSPAGDAPAGEVTAVVEGGAFACRLPAGTFDLRVRAAGFASHYLWAVRIGGGASGELGRLELRPGGSVVGWCVTDAAGTEPEACTLRLVPEAAGLESAEGEDRRKGAMALAARPDARGFFHFRGLGEGSYVLEAVCPGLAVTRVPAVRVFTGVESELREPVVVRPPATLAVTLEPADDPWGRPWRVKLHGAGLTYEPLAEAATAEPLGGGAWRWSGLPAGRYEVEVADAGGDSWLREEVELAPGGEELTVAVPVVAVEGTLTLGAEPLQGVLWFGGFRGLRSIRFDTDAGGAFSGFLPVEGRWDVTVFGRSLPVRRELEGVEVRRAEGDPVARADIALPDTLVEGTVTDEDGAPVAGAEVTCVPLAPKEAQFRMRTNRAGVFRVRGLGPGRLSFSAQDGDAAAEPVEVDVREDASTPRLSLVLRRTIPVSGVVVGPAGPVIGAEVIAYPVGRVAMPGQAGTGADGRFTLMVPAWAAELMVTVMPPGFALRHMGVAVADLGAEGLTVRVEAVGGTLTLLPSRQDGGEERWIGFVLHNGVLLPPPLLGNWAMLNHLPFTVDPAPLVAPQVEAGQYAACRAPVAQAPVLYATVVPPGSVCGPPVFLPPGGEVTLEPPP